MDLQLKNLISLQDIDSRIIEINSIAGDLPQMVKKDEDSLLKLNSELDSISQSIEEIEKENRKLIAENEDGQTKLKKHKDQLYLVKSNKEYDALNKEIDHIKTILSESENRFITIESKKEELLELKKLNKSKINLLNKNIEIGKDKLSKALDESRSEMDALKSNRMDIVGQVESDHLSRYNKLTSANGLGVAPLNDNCCGNCFSTLPPQMVIEIKSNKVIHSCPSCSVIAYWESESEKN